MVNGEKEKAYRKWLSVLRVVVEIVHSVAVLDFLIVVKVVIIYYYSSF